MVADRSLDVWIVNIYFEEAGLQGSNSCT